MNAMTTIDPNEVQVAQRTISEQPLTSITSAGTLSLIDRAATDGEFRRNLLFEARLCEVAATPASAKQIAVHLHRLSLHYPDRKLNEKEAALVAADWLRDLDGVPEDLVEAAFARWRKGPKCAFFPRAGEVLALIEIEQRTRRFLAKRAAEVTDAIRKRQENAA